MSAQRRVNVLLNQLVPSASPLQAQQVAGDSSWWKDVKMGPKDPILGGKI
jgi:hypothetical protein